MIKNSPLRFSLILLLCPLLNGCVVGTVIDVTTDVVIETAKVPFKVGGAVIDVVSDDEDED